MPRPSWKLPAIALGPIFACAAWAQLQGAGARVVLDQDASREVREDLAAHLADWLTWNGFHPPPATRRGSTPAWRVRSPEFSVEVGMFCDGRLFALTQAQASLLVELDPGARPPAILSTSAGNADGTYVFLLDASATGPRSGHTFTRAGIVGCTVTALLPGFRSDVVTIPNPRSAARLDLPPISLHRVEGSSAALVSSTFWSAPSQARTGYQQAKEQLIQDNFAGAAETLRRVVELAPPYAAAWTALAGIQEPADPAAARASYQKAIAADPAYIYPYIPLLRMEMRQGSWAEATATATELLKLCPHGDGEAWYDLAFANDQLGRRAEAEESARQGIADDPDHLVPEMERLLGTMLARNGDTAGAAEHWRNYLEWSPGAPDTAYIEHAIESQGQPAGSAAGIDKSRPVSDLVSVVRTGLRSQTADGRLARTLHDFKLAERLDDRTLETLESEGTGPLTTAELRRLRDESLRRPLPAAPPIASPAPPSHEDQERMWAEASRNSLNYAATLPNFICTEDVRRLHEGEDKPYDTLQLKLTYFNGKEDYQLTGIDGRAAKTSYEQLGGATTKGEFGSELTELFSSESAAESRWDHWTTLRNRPTSVYYFRIPLAHSPDLIEFKVPGASERLYSAKAGQQGFVYVDAATSRVVRITWQSEDAPIHYQIQSGTTQLDYDFIAIAGEPHLLPIDAETRVDALAYRYRNQMEFRDYRKFAADSSVTFDTIKHRPEN